MKLPFEMLSAGTEAYMLHAIGEPCFKPVLWMYRWHRCPKNACPYAEKQPIHLIADVHQSCAQLNIHWALFHHRVTKGP